MKKLAFALLGALAIGVAAAPQEASAHPGWGGPRWHHGWHGGHPWRQGWHGGPRWRHAWYGHRRWTGHYAHRRPHRFFYRAAFVPAPVYVRPAVAFGPECIVKRKVRYTDFGFRKVVTVKTCFGY